MMRRLVMNGSHGVVFKHLYYAFLQGGNNISKEAKPRSLVRLEARIVDKFEAVMEPDSDDKALPWRLKPNHQEQELVFTAEEYEHIDKCIEAVAWPTSGAKSAAAMMDFWGDATKVG
jgi:hypothetical protein